MVQPELLLWTSPCPACPPSRPKAIVKLIQALNKEGITLLIIEHKLKELMKVADRIVAIDFGQKLAAGTPQEVVNHPAVVEAYLGTKDSYASA